MPTCRNQAQVQGRPADVLHLVPVPAAPTSASASPLLHESLMAMTTPQLLHHQRLLSSNIIPHSFPFSSSSFSTTTTTTKTNTTSTSPSSNQ
mmetsp:Transcript_42555/g.48041  ORF Transcript_42555/g.48041 Transcript_42555/m.48041 type:complete len:92 (-) Transcript_42555:15-290(-)